MAVSKVLNPIWLMIHNPTSNVTLDLPYEVSNDEVLFTCQIPADEITFYQRPPKSFEREILTQSPISYFTLYNAMLPKSNPKALTKKKRNNTTTFLYDERDSYVWHFRNISPYSALQVLLQSLLHAILGNKNGHDDNNDEDDDSELPRYLWDESKVFPAQRLSFRNLSVWISV